MFIGIDPGKAGGIAFVSDHPDVTPVAFTMPETERDLLDVFAPSRPTRSQRYFVTRNSRGPCERSQRD